ncbi:mechanosensitive ion channel family protein [bacterium]|nr:mechanosensitive ion channel family protein [bacterium]
MYHLETPFSFSLTALRLQPSIMPGITDCSLALHATSREMITRSNEPATKVQNNTPLSRLDHVLTGKHVDLQTLPPSHIGMKAPFARQETEEMTRVPKPSLNSPVQTMAESEREQITTHGLTILTALQTNNPQAFGDIKPTEVASAIGSLEIPEALEILKESPLSLFGSTASPLATSLAEFLKLEQFQLIDLQQMNYLFELGVKVGVFSVINLVTWFGTSKLQQIFQRLINNSDLSEGKKHFLTQSSRATRIAIVALAAVFSFILVGGNAHVLIATAGIGVLGLSILAKQFFLDLTNYIRVKYNPTYRIGNYISVDDKKGYVLYTNLTHTYLINFFDPQKVDLDNMNGDVRKNGVHIAREQSAKTDITDAPEAQGLDEEDRELPTSELPEYINIRELAATRVPVIRQIPNAFLLAEPVDHYDNRDISDKKELEPYLALLRPKTKPKAPAPEEPEDVEDDDNTGNQREITNQAAMLQTLWRFGF